MPETDFSFSHVEQPAAGACLPRGRHWVRGWVWPKPGGHFVDVRARVGARIFPGIHGHPRADLAAHFNTGRRHALAGFEAAVDLIPGDTTITLEALDLEGRWLPFQSLSCTVQPAEPPVHFATPSGALRWHEYGRLLRLMLWEAGGQPRLDLAALADAVLATVPHPRDLRHPHPPFRGHLDEPAAVTRCGFGRAAVLGHLFHETQPIRRVLATFDLQAWQTVEHARPSPGPAAHYPQFPLAANCGLFGVIDVPAQLPGSVTLRLYAELQDGSLHLCSVQRSRVFTQEDEKSPLPAAGRLDFRSLHAALLAALRRAGRGLVEDDEFRVEVDRVAEDYRRRAPHAGAGPVPPLAGGPDQRRHPVPARVLLVSHNLNFEGAPLFLVDLAQALSRAGSRLVVLSPDEGPLRPRFEAAGAAVHVVDARAVFAAGSPVAARAAVDAIGRAFDFGTYDLVVANTFTTFWAVHAAKAARRRVLLYVHESTTPAGFYQDRVHPAVIALAEEAFGAADAVSFTTGATRAYHTGYGRPENHRLAPGWIDVARLDAWRSAHPRAALRARLGVRDDELLVTNIGTVCDRKGQHIFARAVDLLWRRQPDLAARTRFVMLGGGATPFDGVLGDLLAHLGRANLVVHPATSDYLPYYGAADLFVCSTYEESSPRVILEAMACEAPILSSGVHGVVEQVRSSLEAALVPPGDTVALAAGMARLLRSPELGRELALRARSRVVAEFDAGRILPRHVALAAAAAAGQP